MSKVYQVEVEYEDDHVRRTSVFSTREKAEGCLKSALLKELEEYLDLTNDPADKLDDLRLPQVERLLMAFQESAEDKTCWKIEEKTMDMSEL